MSLISFVVPAFNCQSYIAEAINSLTKQTVKDIEVIIVNDGSTDDSLEIMRFLAKQDKRIKVFNLPKNMGRSYARNYGNSKAKSPVIAVQDADDFSAVIRAKVILKAFKKDPKLDVFYSSFASVDQLGNITQGYRAIDFDLENVKKDKVTYIGHSTMAYKKSVVNQIKYSNGQWCKLGLDDWKLQLDMYRKGFKFGYCSKYMLVFYRVLPNTVSATRDKKKVEEIKCQYLKNLN